MTGRLRSWKAWLAATGFILLSTFAQADSPGIQMPEVGFAPNEDAFHADQYRALYAAAEPGLRSAIQTVLQSDLFTKGLGLKEPYSLRHPILVRIEVIPEESLYHGLQGTAGWKKFNSQWVHVVTLNIAAYIEDPKEDVEAILTHEMAHIVLSDYMGVDETSKIPMWLNEGLAQSVSSEGRKRVKEFAQSLDRNPSMLIACQLDAPVNTFAHGEGNYRCYPQYFLAARLFLKLRGMTSVGQLLLKLKDGLRLTEAFYSATGMEYSVFQRDLNALMIDVVAGRKPVP